MKKLSFEKRMLIADILMWISLGITILWIILKLFGFIKTPIWLELLPIITIVFSFVFFVYKAGNFLGRLGKDMYYMRRDLKELREEFKTHMNKYHA